MKLKLFICFMCCFFLQNLSAQILNRQVKAVIDITVNEEQLRIIAKAENLSKLDQSLTYELTVFKEDVVSKNKSKNKQYGRFVISPEVVKDLSETVVNVSGKKDRTIILLLIRNLDDELIGKARKVIVNGVIQEDVNISNALVAPENKNKDGVMIQGIVLERVKTKPGRDFFNLFYSQYSRYNFQDTRTVLIEEVHDRGRTTKIFIKIDNKKVYEFFVRPNTDYIKANVSIAMRAVYSFFKKKEKGFIVKY